MSHRLITTVIVLALATVIPAHAQPQEPGGTRKTPSTGTGEGMKSPSVSILSIIPAQGEPGTTVILSGTGFSAGTTAFLGSTEVPAKLIEAKQLTFTIPDLAPGLYALFLRREDGTTSRTYSFAVQPLKPIATGLTPDSIDACAAPREREVTISGSNFKAGSQVLFDGAAVRTKFTSSETISFVVPQVAAGLHQVQVRNPEDTYSVTLALLINGRPEITGITTGEGYVNYYNLFVDGKNFQQNSVLVVMEESTVEQNLSPPRMDVKRIRVGTADVISQDVAIFSSCNKLIYRRHPYSTAPKSFQVQVVNPDGTESSVVSITAP